MKKRIFCKFCKIEIIKKKYHYKICMLKNMNKKPKQIIFSSEELQYLYNVLMFVSENYELGKTKQLANVKTKIWKTFKLSQEK
jgi:hypothetical protein